MDLTQYFEISQDARILELQFASEHAPRSSLLFPLRLQLTWALSEPFTAQVNCLSQSPAIELKTLLGQRAGITIRHHDGERTVNGVVTAVRQLGVDGGFSSYRLRIQPALALLAYRRTCRIFQDVSVPDIVSQIVQEHSARNPPIAAGLRLSQQLRQRYVPRSYCTQFDEDDLSFIQRLLAEEGISYTFAFEADQGAPTHTLVLFDDANDLAEATPARIGYRRAEGATPADSLLAWQGERQIVTAATVLTSYDYKPAAASNADDASAIDQGEEGRAISATLQDYSALSPYYASDSGEYARYAQVRQKWHDQRAKTWYGGAATPGLEVGKYVEVADHPSLSGDEGERRQFVVTEQFLDIANNLPADLTRQLPTGLLGLASAEASPPPSLAAVPPPPDGAAHYLRFAGVRRGVPLVPAYVENLRRPTAPGPQTATVVGKAGEVVDTDELGRILVQMHWPRTQEHAKGGADYDERSSTRVRYASPSASDGFGHQFIPRLGDEVLIDFLHGDIDRPIATAVIHNGRRPTAAFSGAGGLPGNRTLSGIATREHNGSGANELLFDDTTGQPRARLATTHHASELVLGYLTHPRKDGEAAARGEGAELRTDGAAALRAAQGLLLTTQAQPGAKGAQLERATLLQLLGQTQELIKTLADAAQAQHAVPADPTAQQAQREGLARWDGGSNVKPAGDGGGQPFLAVYGEAGIAAATSKSISLSAADHVDTAGDRLQQVARKQWVAHAGEQASVFAQGTPGQANAIELIAARGAVEMAAHGGDLRHSAAQALRIEAGDQLLLACADGPVKIIGGGGCLFQMEGGNIDLHCPGAFTVKASQKSFTGGAHASSAMNAWPSTAFNDHFQVHHEDGDVARNWPYELTRADGAMTRGVTSGEGIIQLQQGETLEHVAVRLLPDQPKQPGVGTE
jgi:type VI secretion system secreted protein VgrG